MDAPNINTRVPRTGTDSEPATATDQIRTNGATTSQLQSPASDDPRHQRMRWLHSRTMTLLPNAEVEQRSATRQYLFRRPRALQYYVGDTFVDAEGNRRGPQDVEALNHKLSNDQTDAEKAADERQFGEKRMADAPMAIRARLDLFIDLVWVAIISNISETFSSTAFEDQREYGLALLQFIVLFALSFRIWDQLRNFLNSYFNGDILQGLFILWILSLALFFGNNTVDPIAHHTLRYLIVTVLVSKGSFFAMEIIYAIFVPELRANAMFSTLLMWPSTGALIGSLFVEWPYSSALILPALMFEGILPAVIQSPLGKAMLGNRAHKALDTGHWAERLENFFLIIVGEGVFLLIKSAPLATKIQYQFGAGVTALIIYYAIAMLYFNGDHTTVFIHAVNRNKYGATIFGLFHTILYASLLIFDAGVLYLVQHTSDSMNETTDDTTATAERLRRRQAESGGSTETGNSSTEPEPINYQQAARWITSNSLAIVLLMTIFIALCHKPLKDAQEQLKVNNRYVRLAGRVVLIVILVCLPIAPHMTSNTFLGLLSLFFSLVSYYEYWASTAKNGGIFEPKNPEKSKETRTV